MRIIITTIVLVFVAESALAQGRAYRKKYSKALQQMYEPQSKDYNVGVAYTPLSDGFTNFGVTGYYQSSKRWQWGWNLSYGTQATYFFQLHDFASGVNIDELKVSELNTFGFLRYGMFKWMYLSGGLGFRTGTVSGQATALSTSDSYVDLDTSFQAITIPIAAGTQWNFGKRLTLHVDWLEYQLAISGEATPNSTTTDSVNANANSTVADFEESLNTQLGSANVSLFRLALGYKF